MRTRLILATVASLAMISVAAYATQHDDHAVTTPDATDVVSTDETVGVEAVIEDAAVVTEGEVVAEVVAEDVVTDETVATDETVVEEVVTEDVAAEPTDETVTEVAEEPAH